MKTIFWSLKVYKNYNTHEGGHNKKGGTTLYPKRAYGVSARSGLLPPDEVTGPNGAGEMGKI